MYFCAHNAVLSHQAAARLPGGKKLCAQRHPSPYIQQDRQLHITNASSQDSFLHPVDHRCQSQHCTDLTDCLPSDMGSRAANSSQPTIRERETDPSKRIIPTGELLATTGPCISIRIAHHPLHPSPITALSPDRCGEIGLAGNSTVAFSRDSPSTC